MSRDTPLLSIVPQVMIGMTGGTTARETSANRDAQALRRERRRVRMSQHAHRSQNFMAQAVVLPGLRAINDEHRIGPAAFIALAQPCALVPLGHEVLFARGLSAGVRGDWLAAFHLLIPQLEAGFRSVLLALGATQPEAAQRGEREWGMEEFLYDDDCFARLAKVFGAALVYDARVLLVEKFGGNLRPLFAHGLVPQYTAQSPLVFHLVYLWWLALRLCFAMLHYQAAEILPVEEASRSDSPSVSDSS